MAAGADGLFAGSAKTGLTGINLAGIKLTGDVHQLIGDPVEGRFVVAVMADGTVAGLYPDGSAKTAKLQGSPAAAALAGNRIYIVNFGSSNVVAFDPSDPAKQSSIILSNGARPIDLVSRPKAREAWVTEFGLESACCY